MWRDRYDPMDLFTLVPLLSWAMVPVLVQLDRRLEDDTLFQRVKADLLRRAPHTATRGRPSTPVEVILRMLVVKRWYRRREATAMGSFRFTDIQTRPTEVLDMTSLSIDEFQRLVPSFEAVFQALRPNGASMGNHAPPAVTPPTRTVHCPRRRIDCCLSWST